jgi:hypothetical protein
MHDACDEPDASKSGIAVVFVVACNSIGNDLHSLVFILSAWDECA